MMLELKWFLNNTAQIVYDTGLKSALIRNSTLPQHFWCKGNILGKARITKIIKKYLNQV